mmetsp:Transcript_53202/g.115527  ORF Transcript_53202/g.115527 Transcript_53202/m.115527 type:complete len:379 (-) Transcript_53202:158-1294(-)
MSFLHRVLMCVCVCGGRSLWWRVVVSLVVVIGRRGTEPDHGRRRWRHLPNLALCIARLACMPTHAAPSSRCALLRSPPLLLRCRKSLPRRRCKLELSETDVGLALGDALGEGAGTHKLGGGGGCHALGGGGGGIGLYNVHGLGLQLTQLHHARQHLLIRPLSRLHHPSVGHGEEHGDPAVDEATQWRLEGAGGTEVFVEAVAQVQEVQLGQVDHEGCGTVWVETLHGRHRLEVGGAEEEFEGGFHEGERLVVVPMILQKPPKNHRVFAKVEKEVLLLDKVWCELVVAEPLVAVGPRRLHGVAEPTPADGESRLKVGTQSVQRMLETFVGALEVSHEVPPTVGVAVEHVEVVYLRDIVEYGVPVLEVAQQTRESVDLAV